MIITRILKIMRPIRGCYFVEIKVAAAFTLELAEDPCKRARDSFNNYYVLYNNSSGTNISKWGEYNQVE
jgi:hypothetical protein